MSTNLSVIGVLRDAGTVVIFKGETPEEEIAFAVDHRPAQALADALEAGEQVEVEVEEWQIVGQHPKRSAAEAAVARTPAEAIRLLSGLPFDV